MLEACLLLSICAHIIVYMNLIKIINTLSLALEKDFSSTIGCNMNSHISNANK